ncbi:MAG: thioredoxin family protein [Planctomycetaceae bacterium]
MSFRLTVSTARIAVAFLAATLCYTALVLAQEDSSVELKIGDPAPGWNDLRGTDDKLHSLSDHGNKHVVVVCFTCNSCPYAVDYEDRMIELQKKYADHPQGVVLVAINANKKPSEQMDKMKQRAEEKKFPFAYLIDETQQVANSYKAIYTPEFFVLDKERKVVFVGAMDDKTNAADVTERYVEQAIEAALKGELPKTQRVPARGCAIPYKRSRKQ